MAPEANLPPGDVNVPGDYFSLAGFEVNLYGRFWLTPEGSAQGIRAAGAELKAAANHNALAIACHQKNFPNVDHYRADLVDPDCGFGHKVKFVGHKVKFVGH